MFLSLALALSVGLGVYEGPILEAYNQCQAAEADRPYESVVTAIHTCRIFFQRADGAVCDLPLTPDTVNAVNSTVLLFWSPDTHHCALTAQDDDCQAYARKWLILWFFFPGCLVYCAPYLLYDYLFHPWTSATSEEE